MCFLCKVTSVNKMVRCYIRSWIECRCDIFSTINYSKFMDSEFVSLFNM